MANKGWIGVDLDGTLAFYDHWRGEGHIGPPIPHMVDRVKKWLADGVTVKIFTARMAATEAWELMVVKNAIKNWTKEHLGQELEATCSKDYGMIELWDDRAVTVEHNSGRALTELYIQH